MSDHGAVLALIPARGGSKSIPRKNIKMLGGHPLLAYSVAAGLQARSVDRVIVSTDDEEIAAVARSYGAATPFLRPADLAQDDTMDWPVFHHALQWLAVEEGYRPDVVVQLRPTSPFRPLACVDEAVGILLAHPGTDSVRGVVPAGQNPYKMWRITPEKVMEPLLESTLAEPYNMPRQELPPTYWQTGHIDATRATTILGKQSMSGDVIRPLVLDPAYAVDIDTKQDWRRAEWLLAGGLPIVRPAAPRALFDPDFALLVLDFDGVMTDNRVLVDQDGREAVFSHRGDGWGIARLREKGIGVMVLSTESNPVVAARCRKLDIPCIQDSQDKLSALQEVARQQGLNPSQIAYVGNDVNDLAAMEWVGTPIAVADAAPEVHAVARWTTGRRGGYGAVREVCDVLLAQLR